MCHVKTSIKQKSTPHIFSGNVIFRKHFKIDVSLRKLLEDIYKGQCVPKVFIYEPFYIAKY